VLYIISSTKLLFWSVSS